MAWCGWPLTGPEAAEARIAAKTTNINMYTMDKTGRLGYVHSGRYPNRAPGRHIRAYRLRVMAVWIGRVCAPTRTIQKSAI